MGLELNISSLGDRARFDGGGEDTTTGEKDVTVIENTDFTGFVKKFVSREKKL